MQANTATINQIFLSNVTLKIPFFQRGYVWGEENWERFFHDVKNIVQENMMGINDVYFMGSIIIRQDPNNTQIYDIIDGQQRMTTMVLFMKALCLMMNKNFKFEQDYMRMDFDGNLLPILIPNYREKAVYDEIIRLEIPRSVPKYENRQMDKAFAFFCKKIKEEEAAGEGITALRLYSAVNNNVRFVKIEVQPGENAQQIFETINTAGLKLTTGEMLKNYLFSESMIELYENEWKPVFEAGSNTKYWEDKVVNGRVAGNHTENFFACYMLLKTLDPQIKQALSQGERNHYRKRDGLFNKFRTLLEKFNIDKVSAINEIVDYANLYLNTFKSDALENEISTKPGLERIAYLMLMEDTWTMLPYILYVLKSQTSDYERTKLFNYLESYLMRRIVCGSTNNNYSDMFSENLVGGGINTFQGFKDYVNDDQARGSLLMPSDDEVKEALQTRNIKGAALTVLYMLESKLNPRFGKSVSDDSYSSFLVEQVLPENNAVLATWPNLTNANIEDRKKTAKTLGNFVMTRQKLNAKAKKAQWADKRKAMVDGVKGLWLGRCIDNDKPVQNWGEAEISARNNYMADQIIKVWQK